jgi:hypothetical protein
VGFPVLVEGSAALLEYAGETSFLLFRFEVPPDKLAELREFSV